MAQGIRSNMLRTGTTRRFVAAESAYAAGLFDGEGCVTVAGGLTRTYSLRVVVAMCDLEPIQAMYTWYGGNLNERYRLDGRRLLYEWWGLDMIQEADDRVERSHYDQS